MPINLQVANEITNKLVNDGISPQDAIDTLMGIIANTVEGGVEFAMMTPAGEPVMVTQGIMDDSSLLLESIEKAKAFKPEPVEIAVAPEVEAPDALDVTTLG